MKTGLTVGLTVLVVVALVAGIALLVGFYQTNSKLEEATLDLENATALKEDAQAIAESALHEQEAAEDELADAQKDLEQAESELQAMKPSYDFMTCAVIGPIYPPASFTNPQILERYFADYVVSVWPGATITEIENWMPWNNDPATWYDIWYDYGGEQGFIMSFLVYVDSGLGYVNAIYSMNDECFIVPPAGLPMDLETSVSVQG